MHKQTRLAMEDAMRALRADPPLPFERRQKVARQLEIRIAAEHAEIDRQCALIRRQFEIETRGPGGASGRISRGAPVRPYEEPRAAPSAVRVLSPQERQLPPGDRE